MQKVPEDWNKQKRAQKDTYARWTKKGGQSYFGYKNHVSVGQKSKLIKKYELIAANVHDSNVLEKLCDPNKPMFDDSAYMGQKVPEV